MILLFQCRLPIPQFSGSHFNKLKCKTSYLQRGAKINLNKKTTLDSIYDFDQCCIFVEYDLYKPTTFIQNCIYMNFRINLIQFYINLSRQEHQIELLPDVLVTLRLCAPDDPGGMLRNPYGDSIVKFVSSTLEPVINYTHIIGNHFV